MAVSHSSGAAGIGAWYRYAASLAETVGGMMPNNGNPNHLALTYREPYGVVGVQIPWNTPSLLMAKGAGAALAAGNCIVVKPSEVAPISLLEFALAASEAGFPDGVINVVTGLGPVVGAVLCSHPSVDKLVFTGSPDGGRLVARAAAEGLTPATLELGGESAQIVFPDADLHAATEGLVGGFTASAGQSCVAGWFPDRAVHAL